MISSWIERTFRRKTNSLQYMPVVDGIRFLAIALVFFYHAAQYFTKQWHAPYQLNIFWDTLLEHGSRGVPMFFVLSGFVLALPFARHYLNHEKKPALKDYYLRRLIRLEPPYLIAMTLFFIISLLQQPQNWKHLLLSLSASCVYLHNILFNHYSFINGVAWSLEIEVQFYVIAPVLFLIFKLAPLKRRSVLLLGIILFSLFPLLNLYSFLALPKFLQFFLSGILLADLYLTGFPRFLKNGYIALLMPFILAYTLWLPTYEHRYTMPVYPLCMLLFFIMVLANPVLTKIFSGKLITLIGGMCYSIYLIHGLLIIYVDDWAFRFKIQAGYLTNFLIQASIYAGITMIVCGTYYLLVEKPFMAIDVNKIKTYFRR